MKRLFTSLYLILCLSILGLGWTLENIWESSFGTNNINETPIYMLADLVKQLPDNEQVEYINKIGSNPQRPLALLNKNQIDLGKHKLEQGKILTIIGEHNRQRQYVEIGDKILMLGPIQLNPLKAWETAFTILYYLSLAFIILLWVRPLSRDIKSLEKAAIAFGQAKWDTRIRLPKSSQVMSLGKTFNQMAKQINVLIDNQKHLSNAVSHEIRTPLARLKFALVLLPMYCTDSKTLEERQAFLNDMETDVKEIDALLAEMLTYASLESAQQGIVMEKCDIVALAKQTVNRLQPLSQLPITVNADTSPLFINIEPPLVERALQNLINNAIRYAITGIEVNINHDDEILNLSVKDDGPGIPFDEQEKIFEPFYRSKNEQNDGKGYGLGLAIIKRIMARHHGDVTLASRPNMTVFELSFPMKINKQS